MPAYPMPPAIEHLDVLRIVVRNGFSPDLADLLLEDLRHKTASAVEHGGPLSGTGGARPSTTDAGLDDR